ncbi:MAG: UDP-N-acetylmuramate dehydrogenase [Minisyncoccales bacterium]
MKELKSARTQILKKLLPGIKKNVLLKKYTTLRIGGPTRYFYEAKTKEDLIQAIILAQRLNLPFFILGGGSNLLISDRGFNGLVIKFGQPLSGYINKGLEWAVGIPGTIQAAVYGNAGAFQKSMKDVVEKVEVFDVKTSQIKSFKNKDCQFSYRNSIFKKNKNLIILSVKLKKKKSDFKKIKRYLEYRKKTQPLNFPSAGSVFMNPQKFSAAYLIEKCGLKGKKIGQAKISEKHANFIVNLGRASANDVKKLIGLAKKEVKKKFNINLKEEIVFLGF